jgi:hypothetical protein
MSTFIDHSLSSLFQLFSTVIRSKEMDVDDEETEDQFTDHPTTPPWEHFIQLQRGPPREVVFLSNSA